MPPAIEQHSRRTWVTRGVAGILLATFFSDLGHEMVTAILPLYLSSLGLGAAALGAMEGTADLAFSLSRVAGGWVGHHAHRKKPWALGGYLLTGLATAAGTAAQARTTARFPRRYWVFLAGVCLFGLGDFSRAFLVLLGQRAFGPALGGQAMAGAVLLYAAHNAVSAVAAPIAGRLGDRRLKLGVLAGGYGIGVVTNLLLAAASGSAAVLVGAVLLSGIYIAVEETLEKASAAELLPRQLRSMGFGLLAGANSLGDLGSSLWVGWWLDAGRPGVAFGGAAAAGLAGLAWMSAVTWSVHRAR